jgi:capsular exopolysaccharide synthesis family protein
MWRMLLDQLRIIEMFQLGRPPWLADQRTLRDQSKMLQIAPPNTDLIQEDEFSFAKPSVGAFDEIVAFLRRRWAIIGAFVGLCFLIGLAYILLTTPTYTARSELIIDAHKSPTGQPRTILGDPISDSAVVESQVEVMRSEGVARTVIKQLNLTQDTEFNGDPRSWTGRLVQYLMPGARLPGSQENGGLDFKLSAALAAFARKLEVRRVGLSYVLETKFSSEDPVKAARIANAVVNTYMTEALAARIQGSEKLDLWLQQRMDELRKKLTDALVELQRFKAQSELVDSSQGAIENTAHLRYLEAVVQGYRSIYESFVQSYAETLRASSPSIEARVITEAIPPTKRSWPRTLVVLPLAVLLGTLIGLPIAFGRDQLDRKLRSPSQVRTVLGTRCLGLLAKAARVDPCMEPAKPAIWSAKVAVDVRGLSRPAKVIGVTSALPHEGKTTVATMLGILSAKTGTRTLLIDACLRNPTLTNMYAPEATAGFLDLVASQAALDTVVVTHKPSGLHLLPAAAKNQFEHAPDPLITSTSMRDVLERARGDYDCVIVDLPAITASADVWGSSSLLDGVILVVEWGKTDQATVAEAFRSSELTNDQLVGVLLNKSDLAAYPRLASCRQVLDRYLGHDRTAPVAKLLWGLWVRFGWRESRN